MGNKYFDYDNDNSKFQYVESNDIIETTIIIIITSVTEF